MRARGCRHQVKAACRRRCSDRGGTVYFHQQSMQSLAAGDKCQMCYRPGIHTPIPLSMQVLVKSRHILCPRPAANSQLPSLLVGIPGPLLSNASWYLTPHLSRNFVPQHLSPLWGFNTPTFCTERMVDLILLALMRLGRCGRRPHLLLV